MPCTGCIHDGSGISQFMVSFMSSVSLHCPISGWSRSTLSSAGQLSRPTCWRLTWHTISFGKQWVCRFVLIWCLACSCMISYALTFICPVIRTVFVKKKIPFFLQGTISRGPQSVRKVCRFGWRKLHNSWQVDPTAAAVCQVYFGANSSR